MTFGRIYPHCRTRPSNGLLTEGEHTERGVNCSADLWLLNREKIVQVVTYLNALKCFSIVFDNSSNPFAI